MLGEGYCNVGIVVKNSDNEDFEFIKTVDEMLECESCGLTIPAYLGIMRKQLYITFLGGDVIGCICDECYVEPQKSK